MIKIDYKCEKKEFIRLFVYWRHRSAAGQIRELCTILTFIIFSYISVKTVNLLLMAYDGKFGKVVLLMCGIWGIILFLMFMDIFIFEYRLANKLWEKKLLIQDMDSYLEKIDFYEECVILNGTIFHEKIRKKFTYQDMGKGYVYKTGIIFYKEQIPLVISRNTFSTQEEYEKVGQWIKSSRIRD